MGGNSRKAALKRNIPAVIRARDLSRAIDRNILVADDYLSNTITRALDSPSILTRHERQVIFAAWLRLAEAGQLRGIRHSNN